MEKECSERNVVERNVGICNEGRLLGWLVGYWSGRLLSLHLCGLETSALLLHVSLRGDGLHQAFGH